MMNAAHAATLLTSTGTFAAGAEQRLAGMAGQVGSMSGAQIDKVGKDFESMFVSQMLEQMFGDSLGSEAFGDNETADVYKSMMMDAYGKEIGQAGGIGIASYVKTELLKLQEVKASSKAQESGLNQTEK